MGYVGDKWGRVVSLGISVTGMGVTAVLMALLPSYDYAPGYSVGIAATILMTIIRHMAQRSPPAPGGLTCQ